MKINVWYVVLALFLCYCVFMLTALGLSNSYTIGIVTKGHNAESSVEYVYYVRGVRYSDTTSESPMFDSAPKMNGKYLVKFVSFLPSVSSLMTSHEVPDSLEAGNAPRDGWIGVPYFEQKK